jgi:zinc protease
MANGLRVVAQRLDVVGVVGISVHYSVGFRSEPAGRNGFAHLFEHLMFQGSARVAAGDHFRYMQAAGGSANSATLHDYIEYHASVDGWRIHEGQRCATSAPPFHP